MDPSPLPASGEIFLDARGPDRALRISWHDEVGVVVVSVWRDNICAATFRLPVADVPDLIEVLRAGLNSSFELQRSLLDRVGGGQQAG